MGAGRLIAATAPSFVLVDASPGASVTTRPAVSVVATPGSRLGRCAVRLDPGPHVRFLEQHMPTDLESAQHGALLTPPGRDAAPALLGHDRSQAASKLGGCPASSVTAGHRRDLRLARGALFVGFRGVPRRPLSGDTPSRPRDEVEGRPPAVLGRASPLAPRGPTAIECSSRGTATPQPAPTGRAAKRLVGRLRRPSFIHFAFIRFG